MATQTDPPKSNILSGKRTNSSSSLDVLKSQVYSSVERRGGNKNSDDDDDELFVLGSSDEIPRVRTKKTNKTMQTIAGVAGNILEWYDFAVFGYFSDVIGNVFFPPQEGHAAIFESYVVFGLAFLCRPIGGVFLGYIGDVYGRKRALEISIFLMAFPTFAMGCLPSYARVGNLAIVLLTLVRMLQGLSVGGQLVSSLVYTCENNPKSQWGLYGSFVMAAANFGTLLGGLVSTLMRAVLDDDQLESWGWRIPFLSGILVSFCGLYLKFYCEDDAIEGHHGGSSDGKGSSVENPIKAAFSKGNLRALLAATLVPMVWSGGFYITFVWMAIFMDDLVNPPVPKGFLVNSAALFLSVCLLFPIAGILSDMFGRYKIMLFGGVSLGVLSPLCLAVISKGNSVAAFFAQSAMGIALSLWGAPMCAWLVESFPPAMRLTSVAVGYNIAQALVGGASPALATWLADNVALISPGFYISFIACLSVIGLCIGPDPIEEDENIEKTEPESFISYDGEDSDEDGLSFDDVCETELI